VTEEEWHASDNPRHLLEFHHDNFGRVAKGIKPTDPLHRKARLYACACCYSAIRPDDHNAVRYVAIAESFADSAVSKQVLDAERRSLKLPGWPSRAFTAIDAVNSLLRSPLAVEHVMQICVTNDHSWRIFAHYVREIFGNPFRPVAFDPRWRSSDVVGLARAIYEDRAFDRMPILADALMDEGCADEQILEHCRGAGPHVRGCWVVDLLLGKE